MRIALIGSAPSSLALAPCDDPSWTIWGCSPGAHASLKRVDAFFELHRYQASDPVFYPEYVAWMKGLTCPLYMIEPLEEFPTSVAYPKEEMLERFGRMAPWTSSLSWMAAMAIVTIEECKANPLLVTTGEGDAELVAEEHEIGFWGVDMAATEEYGHQKPGCLYFIEKAQDLGIKVTFPAECDLYRPLPLYGIGEIDPMRVKLTARMAELRGKKNEAWMMAERAKAEFEQAMRGHEYYRGAEEDCQYMLNTWCD